MPIWDWCITVIQVETITPKINNSAIPYNFSNSFLIKCLLLVVIVMGNTNVPLLTWIL